MSSVINIVCIWSMELLLNRRFFGAPGIIGGATVSKKRSGQFIRRRKATLWKA